MADLTLYITENTASGAPLMTAHNGGSGVYGNEVIISVDYDDNYGEATLNDSGPFTSDNPLIQVTHLPDTQTGQVNFIGSPTSHSGSIVTASITITDNYNNTFIQGVTASVIESPDPTITTNAEITNTFQFYIVCLLIMGD